MDTHLFFFSGTGNSYRIAGMIKEQLTGKVTLTGLQSVTKPLKVTAERVGFVVPVYFVTIPRVVLKSIQRIRFEGVRYSFGVVTCGGVAGNALADLQTVLRKGGVDLSSGRVIYMPDSSIFHCSSEKNKKAMLGQYVQQVREFCGVIIQRKENMSGLKPKRIFRIIGAVTRPALLQLLGASRKQAETGCTGCGMCSAFCPAGNIAMRNGKPVFGIHCMDCFGCVHWCPDKAIRFGFMKINEKNRWRHPEVTMQELAGYNSRKKISDNAVVEG